MKFQEMSSNEFVEILATKAPVPGGGGASALVGAIGTALGNMVASLTVGKKKYADVEAQMYEFKEKCDSLQAALLDLVEQDAKVFEPLSKAYSLPRETVEEIAKKEKIMEEALRAAAMVPLEIMERCCEAINMMAFFAEAGSVLAISDAGAGATICRAALEGASLNVFINTKAMKDRAYAQTINQQAVQMLDVYVPKAEQVFNDVKKKLK